MLIISIFLAVMLIAVLLIFRLCEYLDWVDFFCSCFAYLCVVVLWWSCWSIINAEASTTRVAVCDPSGTIISEYIGAFDVEYAEGAVVLDYDDETSVVIPYSLGTILVDKNFEGGSENE